MKKFLIVGVVVLVIFLGYKAWQGMDMNPANATNNQPPTATATQPMSALDKIDAQIALVNSQITSLKTSDQVMQATLNDIKNYLAKLQSDVTALKNKP